MATGKLLGQYSGGLWHVDPAGKVLTTAGQDGLIRRWDLTTNREIPLATGFHKAVRAVFTADGRRVVVGDVMGTIDVFDARTGRKVQEVPRWRDGTDWYTFAVSPDGRTLVATRPEGKMLWWDLAAGKELATMKLPGPVPDQDYHSIGGMAFTPDGRQLVCSYQNATLFAVDTRNAEGTLAGRPPDRQGLRCDRRADRLGRRPARGPRPAPRGPDRRLGVRAASARRGDRPAGEDRRRLREPREGRPAQSDGRRVHAGRPVRGPGIAATVGSRSDTRTR